MKRFISIKNTIHLFWFLKISLCIIGIGNFNQKLMFICDRLESIFIGKFHNSSKLNHFLRAFPIFLKHTIQFRNTFIYDKLTSPLFVMNVSLLP